MHAGASWPAPETRPAWPQGSRLGRLEQPVPVAGRERLHTRPDAELAVDVADVRADRLGADHETLGDRRVRESLRQETEDLLLAPRQVSRGRRRRGPCRATKQGGDAREQLVRLKRLHEVV